jgi:hypothetical protein
VTDPISPGTIIAGHYRTRLIRGGLWVAVRFWFGAPIVDGEELDRSHRWCVEVDGRTDRIDKDEGRVLLDPLEVWPWAGGNPISEREYRFLRRRASWAVEHAPEHPAANPHKPINRRVMPPIGPT